MSGCCAVCSAQDRPLVQLYEGAPPPRPEYVCVECKDAIEQARLELAGLGGDGQRSDAHQGSPLPVELPLYRSGKCVHAIEVSDDLAGLGRILGDGFTAEERRSLLHLGLTPQEVVPA